MCVTRVSCVCSVSYTHLDVYKRQVQWFRWRRGRPQRVSKKTLVLCWFSLCVKYLCQVWLKSVQWFRRRCGRNLSGCAHNNSPKFHRSRMNGIGTHTGQTKKHSFLYIRRWCESLYLHVPIIYQYNAAGSDAFLEWLRKLFVVINMEKYKAICFIHMSVPVSYTHLDVYKRQVIGSRWHCRNVWFCRKHWTTAKYPGKEF